VRFIHREETSLYLLWLSVVYFSSINSYLLGPLFDDDDDDV
jgi:hypothetical protein